MARWSTSMSFPAMTSPCIWYEMPIPATSIDLVLTLERSFFFAAATCCHQVSGCCSAQPGRGESMFIFVSGEFLEMTSSPVSASKRTLWSTSFQYRLREGFFAWWVSPRDWWFWGMSRWINLWNWVTRELEVRNYFTFMTALRMNSQLLHDLVKGIVLLFPFTTSTLLVQNSRRFSNDEFRFQNDMLIR